MPAKSAEAKANAAARTARTNEERKHTLTASRWKVHRAKLRYWAERKRLADLNDVISDSAGEDDARRYQALRNHRLTLMGRLSGMKDAFEQFGMDLDADAAPVVTPEQVKEFIEEIEGDDPRSDIEG